MTGAIHRFRILCALLALLSGCDGSRQVVSLFGGHDRLDIIGKPDRVQAYRVHGAPRGTAQADKSNPSTKPAMNLPDGLRVIAGPVPVDAATAAQLSQILHDPKTYAFNFAKGCMFNPDLAIRFDGSDRQSVVIVFCFTCDELAIYDGATGRQIGAEDDDAKRPQLIEIAKRLFPEDSYIQGLVAQKE